MQQAVIGTLSFAILVPAALWRAFVLIMLWSWFLTPGFGLPVPSYAVAIGISIIVGYLTYRGPSIKQRVAAIENDEDGPTVTWTMLWVGISHEFFAPFWALLGGWVVSHWV